MSSICEECQEPIEDVRRVHMQGGYYLHTGCAEVLNKEYLEAKFGPGSTWKYQFTVERTTPFSGALSKPIYFLACGVCADHVQELLDRQGAKWTHERIPTDEVCHQCNDRHDQRRKGRE